MEYTVIKLGGGLISPREGLLDQELVKGYVKELLKYFSSTAEDKQRVILVVGGGNLSRFYRDASVAIGEDEDVDMHRIGITSTWVNAELIRSILDDYAFKRVLGVGVYAENQKEAEKLMAKDFESWLSGEKPLLVAGGFINGVSTDFNAVLLASKIGVDRFYKLTDVDYVYSADPRVVEDAKPIKDMSWDEFFRLFDVSFDNPEHEPGGHVPIDMFAAKLASENKIGCFLGRGSEPVAITHILQKRDHEGTYVHP